MEKDSTTPRSEPQKGGFLQKISGLPDARDNLAKEAASGNLNVWHRILMGILLTFLAIFFVGAIFVQYLLDSQKQEAASLAPLSLYAKPLPAGDYRIFSLHRSDYGKNTLTTTDYAMISPVTGGVILTMSPKEEMELPPDFYDPDCYWLSVGENGQWSFKETPHLVNLREQFAKELAEDKPTETEKR